MPARLPKPSKSFKKNLMKGLKNALDNLDLTDAMQI
jgi:hypothetical protein